MGLKFRELDLIQIQDEAARKNIVGCLNQLKAKCSKHQISAVGWHELIYDIIVICHTHDIYHLSKQLQITIHQTNWPSGIFVHNLITTVIQGNNH